MSRVSDDVCINALRAFAIAFSRYLIRNGRRTLSIARLTGQKSIRIAIRALMREHDSSTGFLRFMEVLSTIKDCGIDLSKFGMKLEYGDEIYIVLSIDDLEKYIELSPEDIIRVFTSK